MVVPAIACTMDLNDFTETGWQIPWLLEKRDES
jgi:hypothetical protein